MVNQPRQPRGRSDGGQFKDMGHGGNGGLPPTGLAPGQEENLAAARIIHPDNTHGITSDDIMGGMNLLTDNGNAGHLYTTGWAARAYPMPGVAALAIDRLRRTPEGRGELERDWGITSGSLDDLREHYDPQAVERITRAIMGPDPDGSTSAAVAYAGPIEGVTDGRQVSGIMWERLDSAYARQPDPLGARGYHGIEDIASRADTLEARAAGYRQAVNDYQRVRPGLEAQLMGLEAAGADTDAVATAVTDSLEGERPDPHGLTWKDYQREAYRRSLMCRLVRNAETVKPGSMGMDDAAARLHARDPEVLKACEAADVVPRTREQVGDWFAGKRDHAVEEARVKPGPGGLR